MSWDSDTAGPEPGDDSLSESGDEVVVLASFYNWLEADMVAAKLTSMGIESYVRHEALGRVFGLTVDGTGQQDVMVRAADFDLARALLEEA